MFFAARAVVRTVVSDTPELDEAEQVIQAQTWAWGYGPQPPLYTWIQKLFFHALGTTIFALALLNGLILFGTCATAYLAGKNFSGDRRIGLVAMCFASTSLTAVRSVSSYCATRSPGCMLLEPTMLAVPET